MNNSVVLVILSVYNIVYTIKTKYYSINQYEI